jgi:hypothetical protein
MVRSPRRAIDIRLGQTDDFIRAIDLKTDKRSVQIRCREQTIAAVIVFDLAKQ